MKWLVEGGQHVEIAAMKEDGGAVVGEGAKVAGKALERVIH